MPLAGRHLIGGHLEEAHFAGRSASRSTKSVPKAQYGVDFQYGSAMAADRRHPSGGLEVRYARISATKQSLERQLDALSDAGVSDKKIYGDKKSGVTVDRPGLADLLAYARPGDKIEYARLLKSQGASYGEISSKSSIPKTSLHRYLQA